LDKGEKVVLLNAAAEKLLNIRTEAARSQSIDKVFKSSAASGLAETVHIIRSR
jgi:hypothetical protein